MPVPVTRLDGATGSPGHRVPPTPAQGTPAPLPVTQIDDAARAALDAAPTVSLSISRPMPLRDMLHLLVAGTPLSLVLDDAVDGAFEGELKGLTMRQAIEAVLFTQSLDYDVRGTLLRVFPRRTRTRLFDVNYLDTGRVSDQDLRGGAAIPGGGRGARAAVPLASDALGELERGVQSLLSDSGRMHLDRHAGLVQVTDFSDRLEQVALYLEAAEVRASRQVRLEARVFEITLSDPSAPAVDWNAALTRAGAARRAPASAGIRIPDFAALMRAIGEQGQVRVIAAPDLVAMNNEPAVMRIGSQEVYFVPTPSDGARAYTPESALAGLTLTVTAQVASDGYVRLRVAPGYTERTRDARSRNGETVPVLSITEADTNVRVQSGETVVIAGLLQDRDKVTAGTGLAGFFGAQTRETVTSEIVVLLTATVVAPGLPARTGSR